MTNYTNNIGLSNPVPNDPAVANVWGALLNGNATQVDSLFGGILPVNCAGSSNVVLSFTNGSANQTNNAVFKCTGALTGNILVLLPAGKGKGAFIVQNSTSGAFTLAFAVNNGSGGAAGSTVTIPQGGTQIMWSDGTNVVPAITTFVNPVFSGTATFPDGGTWDSGGIKNLTHLGVGVTGGDLANFFESTNGQVQLLAQNPNAGAGAYMQLVAANVTHGIYARMYGQGFTTSFPSIQDGALLYSDGAGGLTIGTSTAAALNLMTNDAYIGRVATDGSLLIGPSSMSNAGAGCISANASIAAGTTIAAGGAITAVGNITAFVSDMRLKTGILPISDATMKLRLLNAFTYQFNDIGLKAGLGKERHFGLAAQEVACVAPEAVARAPINDVLDRFGIEKPVQEYMTVRYADLVPLLVAALKEADIRISLLEERLRQ